MRFAFLLIASVMTGSLTPVFLARIRAILRGIPVAFIIPYPPSSPLLLMPRCPHDPTGLWMLAILSARFLISGINSLLPVARVYSDIKIST